MSKSDEMKRNYVNLASRLAMVFYTISLLVWTIIGFVNGNESNT
ncbi:hypothetical protein SAMN05216243_2975 [Sediminibacillus albus]|uniref:Uncharacterized protein n=1 Tax=Sediminibacillus albus TaxID=407036 RepID=A0A1G9BE49_9BACI|nr:hypothetical protein SAMN05216243_2975 [Sediminibacillus albus]